MDRLARRLNRRIVASFVVIGALLLLASYFLLVRPVTENSEFRNYLKENNLKVGSIQDSSGYGQIYYEYKNKRKYVTNNNRNHISPRSDGHFIVWQEESGGQSQIVLYDILSDLKIELSTLGNNTAASMDDSNVAWQSQANGKPAIHYFDGLGIQQISGRHPAIRPFVGHGKVLYAQQIGMGQDMWQTVLYDSGSKQTKVVAEGHVDDAAWPRFEGDNIVTSNKGSSKYYY